MTSFSTQHSPARYVAMKDSWSHGDDRRDRGRVDRGVTRPRRSRSPASRRPESDREPKARDRSPTKSRPLSRHDGDRPRERSRDCRRRHSRSPLRDSREEVRERNRGRELLDTRGSDRPKRSTQHSPSSNKRRKSRSPSPTRSHHKKSRRATSRSPSRHDGGSVTSSRPDKKRRTLSPVPLPPRKRSPERRNSDIRAEGKSKHHRDSSAFERRGRSRSPKHSENSSRLHGSRHSSDHLYESSSKHNRSPPRQTQKPRQRSPFEKPKDKPHRRAHSPRTDRRSPDIDRYEPSNRPRQQSPRAPRSSNTSKGHSPKREGAGRPPPRDEYRPDHNPPPKSERQVSTGASGANSIGVKGARPSKTSTASGANTIEVKSDKMAGRGFYGGQQGYNPNNQMQAAFPLKPQYNQGPQGDPRQYSQSPQHHMTPNSYHGSPQAQSPYSAGRGNWGGQQQYSPQPLVSKL
jgi:CTD kinase subunit alpha